MKLIQCRFSSGQRVPLLELDGLAAPLPKLVPFIYVQLKFRHRAYNTAAAHLRAIQAFYTYAKIRDLDIDEAILACHFEAILALLDDYAIWLQVEKRWYDLERATDELRRVCAWSDTSTMLRRYASRYLSESANLHNAQRASAAWSRLDS